jgi:DegV family protein with EDD domain
MSNCLLLPEGLRLTMGKIGFVTDSTAYLPPDFQERFGIEVVSLVVSYGDKIIPEVELLDKLDEFYSWLCRTPELPTTSQPSVGDFVKAYQRLAERVDSIISVHISTGISGTARTAEVAAGMLPGLDITVIDSGVTSVGLYLILDAAAQAAEAGCSKKEVLDVIAHIVGTIKVLFVPETLEYLKRGGRIGGAAALVGNLLQIKPILCFNPERNNIIDLYGKVRTREKGIRRMLDEMQKVGPDLMGAVAHVGAPEYGKDLLERVQALFPDMHPFFSDMGPVIGSHIGPGTVGVAFYPLTGPLSPDRLR